MSAEKLKLSPKRDWQKKMILHDEIKKKLKEVNSLLTELFALGE